MGNDLDYTFVWSSNRLCANLDLRHNNFVNFWVCAYYNGLFFIFYNQHEDIALCFYQFEIISR